MAESPRGYAVTLLAGLLAALAVTVGVARPWLSAAARIDNLPLISTTVSGADLAPLAGALGVVLLASFGAVIATAGWVRRGLGGLIVVAAVVVAYSAVAPGGSASAVRDGLAAKGWAGGDYDVATQWWRWVTLAGALVCGAAGATIGRFGGRWATMGSAYDAPRTAPAPSPQPDADETLPSETRRSDADLWQAIDRGHDPTHRR